MEIFQLVKCQPGMNKRRQTCGCSLEAAYASARIMTLSASFDALLNREKTSVSHEKSTECLIPSAETGVRYEDRLLARLLPLLMPSPLHCHALSAKSY